MHSSIALENTDMLMCLRDFMNPSMAQPAVCSALVFSVQ